MKAQRKRTPEEEGVDLVALVRHIWAGKKTILIFVCVGIVFGLISAISMQHSYTVETVLVPQMNARSNSSLAGLAGLAGFDLGVSASSSSDLSPITYPQIVASVPFCKELMYAPLHFEKSDTLICLIDYFRDYNKESALSKVKKYTIGLPFTVLNALRPKKEPHVFAYDSLMVAAAPEEEIKPIALTKEEEGMMEYLSRAVKLTVEKKEGYLTLSVVGMEPRQTADLAAKALEVLQDEVTRFRTEKAQKELAYLQDRYVEVKREAEYYQTALASVMDRSKGVTTTSARIEQERIQSKYTIANAIYMEISKQLEQGKMRVKKDTPVMAVIQPPTIPSKPMNSRSKTFLIRVFLFTILGCGWVIGKDALPKFKAAIKEPAADASADTTAV